MKRYLEHSVLMDLSEKMVFIGGPRQVGKTYFSKDVSKRYYKNPQYLNWDIDFLSLKDDIRVISASKFLSALV